MKHRITDALQIVTAILLTGGIAASAAPLPKQDIQTKSAVVQQIKSETKPVEAPQAPQTPEKAVTWQDNPNHCTDAQYIAQESPFACIDKPVSAPSQPTAPATPLAASIIPGCGDNQYAQYIYQHESGCNLNAVNSLGCRGIGQACPGSKLPCGADYACQNEFFTSYAIGRYGSWEQAYYFWLQNHWW